MRRAQIISADWALQNGQFGSDFSEGGGQEKTDRDYFGALMSIFACLASQAPLRIPLEKSYRGEILSEPTEEP